MPASIVTSDHRPPGSPVTVDDVAQAMHRKPRTIREWCRDGRIPSARKLPNGEWFIPDAAYQRLLEVGPDDPKVSGSDGGPSANLYSTYRHAKGPQRERHIRHEDEDDPATGGQ